ncbi:MAG: bifunctional phosphopantothenoylcysteine decarboxylase/phosphopantothenate--cysteine ligase CoaBC [Saprospiraceae bacterium]|nr:bifunctional phosphopantothenoylcysteine decarboxylase/phosphopantothenate--cysteine ligase CoaBC [Saprospiraceae bacterium]
MPKLQGKKIIVGISGSIAAYKAALLTRLLVKAGADVRVLMTPSATTFITPLTLSTLSRHPVLTEVSTETGWNNHVELGLWADAMVIAPATANTLAKLANGICDTMLAAVYLSARCPVFVAPAMDLDMWHHPSTRENVRRLQAYGNHLIPVGVGELASGLSGEGRMAEPEEVVRLLETFFAPDSTLVGKTVLITAGPTYEPIDPVRFIGNRSSGKMGIALAEEATRRGAKVMLVLGPTHLPKPELKGEVIRVETAQQMHDAALQIFESCDVAIFAAAVADFRPVVAASKKVKKQAGSKGLTLELTETPDIASTLGARKRAGQILVGFALETHDEMQHAFSKLQRKRLDFIVLNSLNDQGAGFQHDTNKISILRQDNSVRDFELKSKLSVAVDILDEVETAIKQQALDKK